MRLFSLKLLLNVTVFFLLTGQTYAATIKGKVTDAGSKEMLVGVVVVVKEMSKGFASDLEGGYVIKHLPIGTYTLVVRYSGYIMQEKHAVIVNDNDVLTLDFAVEPDVHIMEEAVIIAEVDKESDDFSRNREYRADNVINVVSAKTMELSPDITVANVVQRVSGISIERNSNGDGQYAILRGMDKRYNYTLVNGVKIPSPDNKYRYVPLDIFPSEMLERLEVTKSLTPSMEGDAVGGVVNLVMKTAPGKRYVSANLASGFSELFTQQDYQAYKYKGIDYQSPYEHNGKSYNATPANFSNDRITYTNGFPAPNLFGGVALGNRFFKDRLGIMIAGSYQNTYRGSKSLFFNSENAGTEQYAYLTTMNKRNYSEQQNRYGLHTMLDYKIGARHKIQLYSSFINLANIQTRDVRSTNLSNGFEPENGNASLSFSTRSRLTRQRIANMTLQGEHKLTERLKAQWSAVYSSATSEIPDNTTISSTGKEIAFQDKKEFVSGMTRRWEHNSDKDLAAYLNLVYNNKLAGLPYEISTGGLYRSKTRDNFYNNYSFSPVTDFTYVNNEIDYNHVSWRITSPKGDYTNPLNYKATELTTAGYVQLKLDVKRLQIIGGLRVEATNQGYALEYALGADRPEGNQIYTDLLPSVNLKYLLTEKHTVRAAYFRSLNRPGFYEIVPFRVVNEEYTEKGNPDLQRAVADNVDVRYEFRPRPSEQLMAGVFYKKIQNPIEFTLQPDGVRGQDIFYMPGNFGNATNFGIELDAIKYFKSFGIKANYTYTNSSITTPKLQRVINPNNGNIEPRTINQTRPLYGQSANIGNLSLLYNNQRNGISGQVAVSYTGERINTVSSYYENDLWQAAFVQMDASLEKTFKKRLTIFIKANNLLNTPMTVYIKGTNVKNDNVPDQSLEGKTLIRKDYYQRSYMLGIRFKL